jgi:Rad3-related DNA helicase
MMQKYFHQWSDFTVLMSATFADPTKYMKSIALTSAKYIKMDSHFNFDKSPIYFYNKKRMTYKEINQNLPWLYERINEILDKHNEDNGIIHTASYDLTLKIYNNLSHKNKRRVLVYNGTEEKRQVIEMLKANKNKVLMGPSLLEGLDLKDSWSRFQIFAKVPYLSLGDKFVAAKLKINPDWYRWRSAINILQGTGRSVRSENDWAITYILDASLADLIHSNRKLFPIEFLSRLIIVND